MALPPLTPEQRQAAQRQRHRSRQAEDDGQHAERGDDPRHEHAHVRCEIALVERRRFRSLGRQMGERGMKAVAFGINVESQKDDFWQASAGKAKVRRSVMSRCYVFGLCCAVVLAGSRAGVPGADVQPANNASSATIAANRGAGFLPACDI